MIIDAFESTKYRQWFPILVCLFMLLHIERVYITHHVIKLIDHRKFNKLNINVLFDKLMPCENYGCWLENKIMNFVSEWNEIKIILKKNYGKTMLIPTLLLNLALKERIKIIEIWGTKRVVGIYIHGNPW